MGIIPSIAETVAAVAGTAGAVKSLTSGSPKGSSTPPTATGGQSANILPNGSLQNAGLQYLNSASSLGPYGSSYASQFFPQVGAATYSAANNPYAAQSLYGAGVASDYGMNTLGPQQAAGAAALSGLGGQISPYIAWALGQSQQATPGAAYENQYLQQAATPTAGLQYANQALATGFAPNNGLYKQQLQQTQDQSNAINAMYGLGSSPYGANLTDQATQNFNNSFNLNQANLQSQAAGTYSTLMNEQLANQTGNLNAYNSLANTDLNQRLGYAGLGNNLAGTVQSLYGAGNTLGTGAYNTYAAAGGLPAQTYQGLADQSLAALGTGAQNANATLNPFTTYLNSLGNIIGLGQVGQQNAAQQAQTGFNQNQIVGNNLGQSLAQLGGTGTGSLQDLWTQINGGYNPYQSNPYQPNYAVDPSAGFDPNSLGIDLSSFG